MIINLISKSLYINEPNITAVIFELLRPICLIQQTWRARRREKAAYIISRAVLHFLYRPGKLLANDGN